MKIFLKAFISILLLIISFIIYCILFFIVWYSVPISKRNIYNILLILSIISAYLLFLHLIWQIFKNIKIKKVLLALCFVFAFVGTFLIVNIFYNETVAEVKEKRVDYWEYNIVASDSKISRLKEESKCKILNNVPKMDGATALYPVYAAFAKATYPDFAQNHEYVNCSGTAYAYNRIINGECDIIFVASPSKEQEFNANANEVKLQFIPIGKEAFVFIVNVKNPINNISISDIKNIYSGKYKDWSDIGINGLGKIRAFQRSNGSGSQTALENIMGNIPIIDKKVEEYQDFMSGMINSIAVDEGYKNFNNAIGYSFRFYATKMVTSDKIKLLSVEGVEPSVENIKNETYPLSGNFYAVVREDCSKETKLLLDFILSKQGQYLVEDTGYVKIRDSFE